jgi:hypothetical protein
MSNNHEDQLPSIDADTLEDVTGGVTSSSSNNAQVSAALQGIQSSLKNLGQTNNNSGNALSQILPFLMMSRGGAGGGGGACPCGCGMANCRR